MNEETISVLREKMTGAVERYLTENEIKAEGLKAGEEKVLVEVDFGYDDTTKTRHSLNIVLHNDSTLQVGMMHLLDLGPRGAIQNRIKAMFQWFDDKEKVGPQDVFMLQMLADRFFDSCPTRNDFLRAAIEGTNCLALTKVFCDLAGEVDVITHISLDGENVPDGLNDRLDRVFSHVSWILRICRLVDDFLLPDKRVSVAADDLLDERFPGKGGEDKDRPAEDKEEESEDVML